MKRKQTLLLRKLVGEQSQMSWPFADSELHSSNIFQTQSPDYQILDFGPKHSENSVLSRSIVGKVDMFAKQSMQSEKPQKFNSAVNISNFPSKVKKTIPNEPSSVNSSYRSKKGNDNKQKQKCEGSNFQVLDKYELIQSMQKIKKLMETNKKNAEEQMDKIAATAKILKTQHERALDKHEKQLLLWSEVSNKISTRLSNQTTLIQRQTMYRSRIDSLEMFEDLKPEESRNPVITWHQRLRSQYRPQKVIQKEDKERQQLKEDLLAQIPKKEILEIANPQKLIADIKNKQGYDKFRSVSDYNGLKGIVYISKNQMHQNKIKHKYSNSIIFLGRRRNFRLKMRIYDLFLLKMLLFITSGQTEQWVPSYKGPDVCNYSSDPELSLDGEKQAKQTGQQVKKLLDEYMNAQGIQEKDLKLTFMSSPSLACVQTAAIISAEQPKKSKIYIQTELSDLMLPQLYETEMGEDQYQIYSNGRVGNIQKELKIHVMLDKHLKSDKLFESKYPENQNYVRARVGSFIIELIESIYHHKDKMTRVFVCVTHEGVEEIVLDHFNSKCKQINECAITQVYLSADSNDGKLGLKAQSFWKI